MGFDSDKDRATREVGKNISANQLQQNPNLGAGAVDELTKKNKTERSQLKKQILKNQMQQKLEKANQEKSKSRKDGAMDINTKIDAQLQQKQEKQKAQADKEQKQTEKQSNQA